MLGHQPSRLQENAGDLRVSGLHRAVGQRPARFGVAFDVPGFHDPVGANFPADTPSVLSVGGTALSESAGTWTSSAWGEGGSGCSEVFSSPLWQTPTTSSPWPDSKKRVSDSA